MTTNEAKKEFLKSYRNACIKLKSLEEQKSSLIDLMISAKSQKYNDMPKANIQSDLSDYMVRLEKIIKDIDDKNAECLSHKIAIESAILKMSNGSECMVLRKRYLLFMPWESISQDMGYSLKQIHRIHGDALQSFNLEEVTYIAT